MDFIGIFLNLVFGNGVTSWMVTELQIRRAMQLVVLNSQNVDY